MNRERFLNAYRAALLEEYEWCVDTRKLGRFMASCEATLAGASTWNCAGHGVASAWRAIGGEGLPTLEKLRALPSLLT